MVVHRPQSTARASPCSPCPMCKAGVEEAHTGVCAQQSVMMLVVVGLAGAPQHLRREAKGVGEGCRHPNCGWWPPTPERPTFEQPLRGPSQWPWQPVLQAMPVSYRSALQAWRRDHSVCAQHSSSVKPTHVVCGECEPSPGATPVSGKAQGRRGGPPCSEVCCVGTNRPQLVALAAAATTKWQQRTVWQGMRV